MNLNSSDAFWLVFRLISVAIWLVHNVTHMETGYKIGLAVQLKQLQPKQPLQCGSTDSTWLNLPLLLSTPLKQIKETILIQSFFALEVCQRRKY